MNQLSNVPAGPSNSLATNNFRATIEFSMRKATGGSSTDEDVGHRQISNAEKKIIVTMLTVTVCFIICWYPLDLIVNFLGGLPRTVGTTGSSVLTFLAYMNVLLNAMIHSLRFGVITRVWRAFRGLDIVLAAITVTHANPD
jgi:hypothetical protein